MKLFVWSKYYYADMGDHVFPTAKYHLIREMALNEGIAEPGEFLEPQMPNDLEIVHTKEHIQRLSELSRKPEGMLNGENPINESVFKAAILSCDGTYKACNLALRNSVSMHIGGGFHHAFPDHEEGFCYFNDVGYAIRKLLREKRIGKAMVIDCDIHQGNGTAAIFSDNADVFTFSIHQEDNYPVKERSDYDIGLYSWDNIDDEKYLNSLKVVINLVDDFRPEIIIYEAGADPFKDDKLGGFRLSKEGLGRRDKYIMNLAKERRIPAAVVLGGGYAKNIEDTVEIHTNTLKVVKEFSKNYLS